MFNEGNDSGGSDGIESGGKPKLKRYFGCFLKIRVTVLT